MDAVAGREARPPPGDEYQRRLAELHALVYDVIKDYYLFRIDLEVARYRYALYSRAISDLRRFRFSR
jgi:hypothetical protein